MQIKSYGKLYSLGHRLLYNIFDDEVIAEEKVDGCVTSDTPILTAKLEWVPAGSLKVGDELIGFEDKLSSPKMKLSKVTSVAKPKKESFKIETEEGQTVIASHDHPWFVSKLHHKSDNTHSQKEWVESKNLKPGDKVLGLPVWKKENTFEAGWLSGFFDGEGTLSRTGNCCHLTVYQATDNDSYPTLIENMKNTGFRFYEHKRKRDKKHKETTSLSIRGGWSEQLRFLGTYRPSKLIEKSRICWEGRGMNFLPRYTIKKITPVGRKTLAGFSTSTQTYIAAGMLCHNSQFSFGKRDGQLVCRSKNQMINIDAPDNLFFNGVEAMKTLLPKMVEGWTYRGEYLRKEKHNALTYSRVPKHHVILFDVDKGDQHYVSYEEKKKIAEELGVDCVPLLFKGRIDTIDDVKHLMDTESALGGPKIEGLVFKNYKQFDERTGKCLMGKFVSEAFKEVHRKEWKDTNPNRKELIEGLIDQYRTEARWNKAIQHLRDDGKLLNEPKDIGPLLKELSKDFEEECVDEIKDVLWKNFRKALLHGIQKGFANYYKELLLERQFAIEEIKRKNKEGDFSLPHLDDRNDPPLL